MKEIQAIVERVVEVNKRFQRLHLSVGDAFSEIKPGQAVLARLLPERWDPYLRELWWPVEMQPNMLVVERPANVQYQIGQIVSLLGLVGQPFRYKRTLRNVLLMAYDTPPVPLLMSMGWLLSNKISVTLVLCGEKADYPAAHLPKEIEILRADDKLQWPNQVMTVGWADQVFVAVAPDDEMGRFASVFRIFRDLRAEVPKNYLFGVFQPALPCGIGACQACMIPLRGGENTLICTDGPALDLTTVNLSV